MLVIKIYLLICILLYVATLKTKPEAFVTSTLAVKLLGFFVLPIMLLIVLFNGDSEENK